MLVEGGKVYVAPAGAMLTIQGGRLQLRPLDAGPGGRAVIDSFLLSLAEDQGERAVAVVFRDTADHGTLGFAAVKEYGGLTIAEADAARVGADLGSEPMALADFVLPAEQMHERISLYVRHLTTAAETARMEAPLPDMSGLLTRIAGILRNNTGHDFHGYKQNTFLRRVQRRMQVVQVDDRGGLRRDPAPAMPDEVQHLFNDLLIGVTQFFRDPQRVRAARNARSSRSSSRARAPAQVRVWVLGCATGEEAYSLAILLREHMAHDGHRPAGPDLRHRPRRARAGRGARRALLRRASPGTSTRSGWRAGSSRRATPTAWSRSCGRCASSRQHNLIKDAPFSRLDLISCRNLLIYLNAGPAGAGHPAVPLRAAARAAILFLGNSENVTRHAQAVRADRPPRPDLPPAGHAHAR